MIPQQYPSLSLDPPVNGESDPMSGPMTIKAYDLKGFMFSVLTMCLKHIDVQVIEYQLRHELAKLPDFFSEPLVIDLNEISKTEMIPDFHALISMIRGLGLVPIGICNGSHTQCAAARSAGMPVLEGGAAPKRRPAVDHAKEQKEREAEARRQEAAAEANKAAETRPTHIIDTPVRTGQRVFSKGDLTLLAGVNAGAEVLAAGSIHVYGPLRGRALAGVAGDTNARIFTKCMEAELVSIAGCFRVLENDLGADLQGKPAQIYLDGERVVIKPL